MSVLCCESVCVRMKNVKLNRWKRDEKIRIIKPNKEARQRKPNGNERKKSMRAREIKKKKETANHQNSMALSHFHFKAE